MRGTIRDFLKLAEAKPELAKKLVELAAEFDFEFTDEVSDENLESSWKSWPSRLRKE
jgi:hypothetical protein